MNRIKIGIAMSGGVDSTTTASLLKEQGYEIFGATMYLFDVQDENGHWGPPAFINEAKEACKNLGISHFIVDLRKSFEETIITPFVEGYLSGETPNPCAVCNPKIKYGLFMDEVLRLGADYMATGHYVRLMKDEWGIHLLKGLTDRKDQSFYLYGLSEDKLNKIILPLGQYVNKEAVREKAQSFGLKAATKKDSLGVCFTQGQLPFDYIKNKCTKDFGKGTFVDKFGNILGFHEGYYQFTIGQKKGLPSCENGKSPWVVTAIRPEKAEVVIGGEEDLYHQTLKVKEVHWIHEPTQLPWKGTFRICTWGYDLSGEIQRPEEDLEHLEVVFEKPVRAIALGQACVFYQGEEIMGGGIICEKK